MSVISVLTGGERMGINMEIFEAEKLARILWSNSR